VISRGTPLEQRIARAEISNQIAEAASHLESPALLVVGEVVSVGDRLAASRASAHNLRV